MSVSVASPCALRRCGIFPVLALLACFSSTAQAQLRANASANAGYGQVPLHFELNRGQAPKEVRFLARGAGYSLYLTGNEAMLVLTANGKNQGARKQPRAQPLTLGMRLADARPAPEVSGVDELPGKANYLIGPDAAAWRTNVPTYAKVHYRGVYPGIDLVYYGRQRQLEYDFVVAPGANPKRIALDFIGAEKIELDATGNLVLHTAKGALRQHKPVIYQEIDGIRYGIDGRYVIKGGNRVGFEVAAYDRGQALVIDPVLTYATYLGGGGDDTGRAIAVNASGNVYVTGSTASVDFAVSAGGVQRGNAGGTDVFVSKLNAAGSALVYSTYFGGSGDEAGDGIALDTAGNAYVTGMTASPNFPTSAGAFQATLRGGRDAFVTKLNAAGSAFVYSTFLGGDGNADSDWGAAIAVDALGGAYVTGNTYSRNFPTTAAAVQPVFPGTADFNAYCAFVTKFNVAGSGLVYSSFLGGSSDRAGDLGTAITVDRSGNAYVTGRTSSFDFPVTAGAAQPALRDGGLGIPTDAFVTKFNSTGSALVYSSFLGGSYDDTGNGIALDAAGNTYVAGVTASPDFPTTAGAYNAAAPGGSSAAFVTKISATGAALVYSTYLGGRSGTEAKGIAVDVSGAASVTGITYLNCGRFSCTADFPTTTGALQPAFGGGLTDGFVATLNAAGSRLIHSSYLGASGVDGGTAIAVDAARNVYVTGYTQSADFPATPGVVQPGHAGGFDAFVAKLSADAPDLTSPRTAATTIPPANPAGWNQGPVIVMLNAADNAGGSGIESIAYSINGAAPVVVSGAAASLTFSAEQVSTLTYRATDQAGNVEAPKTLKVRIDATPPSGTVALAPRTLWPADHRLVRITPSLSARDNLGGPVKVRGPVVTSNEPQKGLGSGDRAPDWIVIGGSLWLRAERSSTGTGRIYTVTYTFTDLAGNSSQASATVSVPRHR